MVTGQQIGKKIQSLGQINKALERGLAAIGTAKDSSRTRTELSAKRGEGGQLVADIENGLLDDSLKSHEVNKLSKQFERLRNRFIELDEQIETKQLRAGTPAASSNDSPLMSYQTDAYGAEGGGLQQQDQIQFQEYDESLDIQNKKRAVEKRKDDILNVTKEIEDLNQIQTDFNEIVHEQQADIDVMEENVTDAHQAIETAADDIDKAAAYQAAARKKQLMFVTILVLLIAAGVLIAGWQLGWFESK